MVVEAMAEERLVIRHVYKENPVWPQICISIDLKNFEWQIKTVVTEYFKSKYEISDIEHYFKNIFNYGHIEVRIGPAYKADRVYMWGGLLNQETFKEVSMEKPQNNSG